MIDIVKNVVLKKNSMDLLEAFEIVLAHAAVNMENEKAGLLNEEISRDDLAYKVIEDFKETIWEFRNREK